MNRILLFIIASLYVCTTFAESTIAIDCNLEGAIVHIDGVYKGECPLEAVVRAGDHDISIANKTDNQISYRFKKHIKIGDKVTQRVFAKLVAEYAERDWRRIEKHGSIDEIKGFLKKYPQSKFENLVIAKIARLEKGKKLYFDGTKNVPNCATCHGDDAIGNVGLGVKPIAGKKVDYIKDQLNDYAKWKRNDRGMFVMGTIAGELTITQRNNLAIYINSLPVKSK